MRLLIVGLPTSIHLYRAAAGLAGQGWDIHLFPAIHLPWLDDFADLAEVTLHHVEDHPIPEGARARSIDHRDARRALDHTDDPRTRILARVIESLDPDLIHSHEILQAGYLVEGARRLLDRPVPPWIVSNWGSDLYLWSRTAERESLRAVLAHCDAYWSECHRDVGLAWAEGFRGTVLPVLPIAGGFDLDAVGALRSPGPTSARRTIAVKGYTHWISRSGDAVASLLRCRDLLDGYTIALYAVGDDEIVTLARKAERFGAEVVVMPRVDHDEIIALHGRSRISIGLSISDGTSTSFLEALAGGSFPVQSRTACAHEWVVHEQTGMLVDHRDPRRMDEALRRALTDDELIDSGVARNDRIVAERLDRATVTAQVVAAYELVLDQIGDRATRTDERAVGTTT